MSLLGAIEAGGTKFILGVGTGPDDLITAEVRTTTPAETMPQVIDFFRQHAIEALGIGAFGPIDLNQSSLTYGFITTTPKQAWRNFDFLGTMKNEFAIPMGWDTDVNAAALAEARWGAGEGLDHLIYLTIGTGIGGGALVHGQLLHGLMHPEMGHLRLPRLPGDTFAGICPSHGDCWEGMVCGPALAARLGFDAKQARDDHEIWRTSGAYIGMALANIVYTLSPQRIVMGGGVGARPVVREVAIKHLQATLRGYIQLRAVLEDIDQFVVAPKLGGRAGVLGALALAELAARSR